MAKQKEEICELCGIEPQEENESRCEECLEEYKDNLYPDR